MEIKEAIQKLAFSNEQIYSLVCEVIKVNDDRTCDVSPLNGDADIPGVRLQASISSEVGLYMKPKPGSHVMVTFFNKHSAFVSQYSEVEETKLSIGNYSMEITGVDDKEMEMKIGGFSMKMKEGEVVFKGENEKNLNGLVNIGNLVDKINGLIDDFNSHTHVHTDSNAAVLETDSIIDKSLKFKEIHIQTDKITH